MNYHEIMPEIVDAWKQGIMTISNVIDQGIYPAANNGVPRSEKQNGWNDAVMDFDEKLRLFEDAFDKDWFKPLIYLAINDLIFLRYKNQEIVILLLCSDTFTYACADCEEIEKENLIEVCEIYDKFGYDGLVAWVAIRRSEEPIKERQTEEYKEAYEFLIQD